ncbi:AAA family ATPase [Salinigranum marinum]|uniref:AAA family ATPase n=1 Tax=Salinigranum marinum TaxID=1515595 RepID=UPI002989B033|nr:AAA family ATPase [Salinigranum marinum]
MTLTVKPVSRADAEDGVAVLGPSAMDAVGVSEGAYVRLVGPDGDETVARIRAGDDRAGADAIRVDRYLRRALDADVGDEVTVEQAAVEDATAVTVALPPMTDDGDRALSFRDALVGRAVLADQTLGVALETAAGGGGYTADAAHRYHIHVVDTEPDGPVVVREWTTLTVAGDAAETVDGDRAAEARPGQSAEATNGHPSDASAPRLAPRPVSYDDVGGLADELAQIRETVELPLRHPDVFERFGVDPPTGLLLHGPPGTGKSLVARAVAHETDVHVEAVSGSAIRSKYAGETEARLRELFESAAEHDAAIVLVDDLGAIAGGREDGVDGDGGAVAQLLAVMDDLDRRSRTVVIGRTTRPEEIDAGLRRPGRFDREVEIGVPDRDGREEILRIHTRSIPLADDVDLSAYAERTHGFVGSDLENLLRESVMRAIRRLRPETDGDADAVDPAAGDVFSSIDADDATVTAADVEAALRTTEPSALREVFVEVPEVSWADVGGLDAVKERLRESVQWPLLYAEAFERVSLRPPTGILLYGPPGTGKTLLAKAVANEADSNFISVKGPELLDKYVGESEKGVREVFAKARENAPTVVFFDEIDAIATERGSGTTTGVTERVVSQLLTELDGLEDLKDVVVVATTNRPGLVDDALLRPGRFDRHVHVGVPDEAGRREIFTVHTEGRPLADDVDLDHLARETEGYVGADIEAVCREAATAAVRSHVTTGEPVEEITLTAAGFEQALDEVDASEDGDGRFDDFEERMERRDGG